MYKRSNYTARIRANQRTKQLVKKRYVKNMYIKLRGDLISSLEFVENFYDILYENQARRDLDVYLPEDVGIDSLDFNVEDLHHTRTRKLIYLKLHILRKFVKIFSPIQLILIIYT